MKDEVITCCVVLGVGFIAGIVLVISCMPSQRVERASWCDSYTNRTHFADCMKEGSEYE